MRGRDLPQLLVIYTCSPALPWGKDASLSSDVALFAVIRQHLVPNWTTYRLLFVIFLYRAMCSTRI
jgi:hypothetical protein